MFFCPFTTPERKPQSLCRLVALGTAGGLERYQQLTPGIFRQLSAVQATGPPGIAPDEANTRAGWLLVDQTFRRLIPEPLLSLCRYQR
jgi:hypothetical protein